MNFDKIKEKLFSEDDSDVFTALSNIENNPDEGYGKILLERIKKEKNNFIVIKIMEIASKIESDELIEGIFRNLKNTKDEYIKATLIKLLSNSTEKDYKEFIKTNLFNQDDRVRANAVECVENLKMKEAVPDLVKLLKDNSARVKINAAKALYRFGDERMLKVFEKLLYSKDRFVGESVLHTLKVIGGEKTYAILKDFLDNCKNERLTIKLLDIFADIGKEDVIHLIRQRTTGHNPKVQESAQFAIKRILKRQNDIKRCSSCGSVSKAGMKFCGSCGKSLV